MAFGVSIFTTVSAPDCESVALLAMLSSITIDVGIPVRVAFFNTNVVDVPLALIDAVA